MTAEPITPAAESGDRGQALTVLRDRLAADIDVCKSAREVAALSQRLLDVLDRIAEINAGQQPPRTGLDDFQQRLRDRERSRPAGRARAPQRTTHDEHR